MAFVWTLKVADTTKAFAAWGLVNPIFVFRSLDVDELKFAIMGDVFGACPLAFGQPVDVYRDELHYFQGTVTDVRAGGRSRASGWSITCSNVWWQLQRTMYQQEMASYSPPPTCAFSGTVKTTKVVLFQDALTGLSITTGQQLQAVVTYAVGLGLPLVLGSAPEFITVPFDTARDLTLADAIRRCLQPTPDAVSWFDYSGGTPAIFFRKRELLETVAIDFAADPPLIDEFSLRQRDDLIPAGVRFAYVSSMVCGSPDVGAGCPDPANGVVNATSGTIASAASGEVTRIQLDDAGLPELPGGLIGTIDLSTAPHDQAPLGLAAQYYLSLLTPQWEGSLTLRARDCSGTVRPGKAINLANGNPAWAAMAAVVQEVQETIFSGETEISLGPPNHLGPQDFVALIQFTRRRALVSNAFASTRPPGTPDAVNCDAGKSPAAKDAIARLAANSQAAANAIGGEPMVKTIEAAGALGTVSLELCDPPGAHVSIYAPPAT